MAQAAAREDEKLTFERQQHANDHRQSIACFFASPVRLLFGRVKTKQEKTLPSLVPSRTGSQLSFIPRTRLMFAAPMDPRPTLSVWRASWLTPERLIHHENKRCEHRLFSSPARRVVSICMQQIRTQFGHCCAAARLARNKGKMPTQGDARH